MGKGALIGAIAGAAIGVLAESSSNEEPFVEEVGIALVGGIGGGLAGLGIGAIIGAIPTGEKKVRIFPDQPFLILKLLSRFPFGEPE